MRDTLFLYRSARQGDPGAEDRLTRHILPRLYRMARRALASIGRGLSVESVEIADLVAVDIARTEAAGEVSPADIDGLFYNRVRQRVIEQLRRRRALKRGGCLRRLPLNEAIPAGIDPAGEYLDLKLALERLRREDPDGHRAVVLRTLEDRAWESVAEEMNVSVSTCKRKWIKSIDMIKSYI